MKKVIVVIPVYKQVENLHNLEKISIRNTINKFQNIYTIALLNSDKISVQTYANYFNFDFSNFEFTFSSWTEYNCLLKKIDLYKKMDDYDYMLLIQTDAYVFSNDLNDYLEYDYVGAPWPKDPLRYIKGSVGNGGFSLRNIQKIKSILMSNTRIFGFRSLLYINFKHEYKFGKMYRYKGFKKFKLKQIIFLFINTIVHYFLFNSFKKAHKLDSVIEDVLFGVLIPDQFRNYNVPDLSVALRFSIDENPIKYFEQNDRRLPVGCHAFIKNYDKFWINFIEFKTFL